MHLSHKCSIKLKCCMFFFNSQLNDHHLVITVSFRPFPLDVLKLATKDNACQVFKSHHNSCQGLFNLLFRNADPFSSYFTKAIG